MTKRMSAMRSALILTALLLLPARASAGDAPLLTPGEAVTEALRANPEIAAAEHAWRAAAEVPRQASSLDDPELSYEAWNTPHPFAFDRADNNIYSLSQRIPFPGKLGLRGKAARIAADAAKQRYEQKRLEIAARVKAAYADLFQAERDIEIYRRYKDLSRDLAETARARYEAGEAPQQDLLKAQFELTQVDREINSTEEARRGALARLNALLDRPQEAAARTVEELPVRTLARVVEELERDAATQRPAVRAAALEVDRAETERRLARRRWLPDFEIRGSRFVNTGTDNGYGAMLAINVPWIWRGKHEAAIAEAAERKLEAASDLRAEKNETARGVRELYARTERAYRNAELLRTALLPQARLTLDSSLASYEAGETDFLNVLNGFQSLLYIETQQVQEVANWTAGVAGLEEMVGHPIE